MRAGPYLRVCLPSRVPTESTVHALSVSVRLIVTAHSPSDACVCSDEVRASSCGGGAASLGELQHPNVTPENTRRPYVWSDVSSCVNYNTGLCPDSVSRRSPCVCVLRIYIYISSSQLPRIMWEAPCTGVARPGRWAMYICTVGIWQRGVRAYTTPSL